VDRVTRPVVRKMMEDLAEKLLARYAPGIYESGRNAGVLDALRAHGPEDDGQKLLWLVETPWSDVNPYAGEPFDFAAHDAGLAEEEEEEKT
jgi:hypothetical protein